MAEQDKCTGQNRDGSPCGAKPLPGRDLCVWHCPERQAERAEWSRQGGSARSNQARARKQLPADFTVDDLRGTLAIVLARTVRGDMAPGVATATATVARAWLLANEAADLVGRIESLEAAAEQRRGA
jgi:hypothetical protein